MITELVKVDGHRVVAALREVAQSLERAHGELVLDFSSVTRIDPGGLEEMEKLAGLAGEKAIKVGLRGVNIDIYKVLKLMKLAPRFSFLT